ncbi:SOS response-associated peptidase [Oceanitalea stevensii]|uniref:Abasic site processing protein n=1 Tax=Oceanitalea stevensii TaxID=2763072 RepID=A0ABR8Z4G2_9MICO|nr:SOS response-associated peptidase [Oceanitalea stevensii]MBD8063215.1 SOS response-associated peptidase [Oceanitalea stevensii]
MCGRYASFRQAQELADAFDVDEIADEAIDVHPSFNVAPTDQVRVVLERADSGRQMHAARWGLVPAFASDPKIGVRMINARIETVAEKNAFAKSLRTRRCILPADGYYEWRKNPDGSKTPHFIHRADAAPLAFAGLYAFWRDPSKAESDPNRWLLSTTILTQPARSQLAGIHDREPVVLRRAAVAQWLDLSVTTPEEALAAIAPERPRLQFHRVGPQVGNVRVDSPALIEPVD